MEAAEAVAALIHAAAQGGLALVGVSATRTFEQQRAIWEGKFTGERQVEGRNLAEDYPDPLERSRAILAYSAAPGMSRHHWGTDVDFNSTASGYWQSAVGLAALAWLEERAGGFGFVMAYPPGREQGHSHEPWHWSYQPLARPLLRNYHRRVVSGEDLAGFRGAEAVRRLQWREWYVYGVDEVLK
ncbi:MAG: D-alanyl-D-alanine carboxypeptidase family protein [Candidatus Neomarinimicrobiota bacterium]